MKNLPLRTILIASLIAILGLVLYPPQDSLRLGKDLAGGTSLTYTVFLEDVDNPDETVDRMIEILKNRVNPRGLYEISFVRQGRDRLVISMPLPTEQVREARQRFDEAVATVAEYDLDETRLQRALRLSGEARKSAIEALMDTPEHRSLLEPLLAAVERADIAEQAYRAAQSDPTVTEDALDELLAEAAAARRAVADARDRALNSTVSERRVRGALQQSPQDVIIPDRDGGEPLTLESPRERALNSLFDRLEGLDGAVGALERAVAAYEDFEAVRQGLDDPADLQRILQGSGVLEFRIAPTPSTEEDSPFAATPSDERELREQLQNRGPDGVDNDQFIWRPLFKLEGFVDNRAAYDALLRDPAAFFAGRGYIVEEYNGQYYMLLSNRVGERLTQAEGGGQWAVSDAYPSTDQLGRPAIGFEMDAKGANLLADLTEANTQRAMAILLDDRVYTAPNINSRISSRGIIEGTYTRREINELINTLAAGSLSAKLGEEPISVVTIAPDLGTENLMRGLLSGVFALVVVAVFMVIYYFTHGVIAVISLLANAIIILGIMSLSRAAFTLPGIAGIVLTFGMAVDANVLIFERIREELLAGNDLRTAVRLGYQKVLSTIVDANVTNLIVCFVLAYTATEEVKGFAITLGVGVVATMFSALVISRVLYAWLIERFGLRQMSQLPMKLPPLQRAFEPNVDWIKLRYAFRFVSIAFVGLGIGMIVYQGEEMLDTEFRGGTAVTLQLGLDDSTPDPDDRITLSRADVQERLDQLARRVVEERGEDDPLTDIRTADPVGRNPDPATNESSEWQIKTIVGRDSPEDRNELFDLITQAFGDVLDIPPVLRFAGEDAEVISDIPVARITTPELGSSLVAEGRRLQNIDNTAAVSDDVEGYINRGVAFVLENVRAAEAQGPGARPTRQSLVDRIQVVREQPDFASDALKRSYEVRVLAGENDAVETAVVLVRADGVDWADPDVYRRIAEQEWTIIQEALTESEPLAGVQSFSAEIAASFRGQAIIAVILSFVLILIYIWARFGSVRYSLAAIVALMHDVLIAIGLIALAEILYDNVPFLATIGLEPYKIDLALVAAILTIVGYSLNDTIVILDRIRENRGKLAYASAKTINLSINQTVSRTIITSGTTLLALIVLFAEGGPALSSFTYALICGVIVGTYSSIAVAAPFVYTKNIPEASRKFARDDAAPNTGGSDRP